MSNRANTRRATRTSVALPGFVRGFEGRLNFPCRIVDLSATGARISLEQSQYRTRVAGDLPERVILFLPLDKLEVLGLIVWRIREHLGIRFMSPFRPVKTPVRGSRYASS